MAEPVVPISSSTLGPEEISGRSFSIVRRGLDPDAVRRFLDEVATTVREARSRENSLRLLLEDAQHRANSPQIDEATLSAAVGAETARVLQVAHEAAQEVISKAEAKAAAIVSSAESEIDERVRSAQQEASTILTRANAEADATIESAKRTCMEMVEEAREARRRILGDLVERRRSLHGQLEQLRAGKDSLAQVVETVGRSVEAIRARITGAEAEAREAADVAARTPASYDDGVSIDELVAHALADRPTDPARATDEQELMDTLAAEAERDEVDALASVLGEPMIASTTIETEVTDTEHVEVVPESLVEQHVVTEAAFDESADPSSAVDELFAKIRASREEELDRARGVLEGSGVGGAEGETVEGPTVGAARDDEHDDASASSVATASNEPEAKGAFVLHESPESRESSDSPEELANETAESPGDARFTRRDELLEPELVQLARALKRALSSEQNELLDSIRNLARNDEPEKLLDEQSSVERVALSCSEAMSNLYRAGVSFANELLAGSSTSSEERNGADALVVDKEASIAGDELARDLASVAIVAIERRISDGLGEVGRDQGALSALVGSAYRDWKGPRVDVLAGDFATKAFAMGTRAVASHRGVKLAWVLHHEGIECGECDDNALAGELSPSEAFSTGHLEPPAHPGCRCLLAPLNS